VQGQATLAFTKEEDERLREISRVLEKKLDLCVPVSWNSMKESQRFLNTRTYGLGKVHGGVHARQVMCPSSLSSRPHVLTHHAPSCCVLCCARQAESYPLVESVVKALEDEGLQTIKVIREFIVSDSNKALDNGWLEPLPA
jgi:hypothetical protein